MAQVAAGVTQASLELPVAPPPAAIQQPNANSADHFAHTASPLPNMPVAMPRGLAAAAGDDSEVIVIVRSRSNPTKQSEIFMLDRPPAEVIRLLQAEARPAPHGSSQDLLRSATRLGQDLNGPVVRGQSQE